MIIYNGKKWIGAVTHFHRSWVIRVTLRTVFLLGVYATAVATFYYFAGTFNEGTTHRRYDLGLDPTIFSLLGVFLGFLLVFRINSSYERWWEGRKQWGALINHSRGLAVLLNGMLRAEDHPNRSFFARGISAYVLALKDHLRDFGNHDMIAVYSEQPPSAYAHIGHIPNKIVNDLYLRVERLYRDGFIDGFQLRNIKAETQSFLDIQGACERIKATPIPFAHNFLIKCFVIIYCMLLPFVLIPILEVSFSSIPMVMLVSYALIGIEYISVEIEEPFGMDCNDLPTNALAIKIGKNVHEILEIPFDLTVEEEPSEIYAKQH
jgi:putative membrane protein